jgi:uroporphyrinogen decarboxylase
VPMSDPIQSDPAIHRNRLLAVLNHQEPDRVPIAFGGPSCSIHQLAHRNLLGYLGYAVTQPARVIDRILQIVEPDMRLCERFDVDVLWLIPDEGPVQWGPHQETYVDELGRSFKLGGGFYNQTESPLKAGTTEELAAYRFPDLWCGSCVAGLAGVAQSLHETGYGLATDGPWGLYEYCSSLRGAPELFMDMVLNPGYVEALAERVLEEHLKPYYTLMLEAVAPYVQMVGISDDYGSQNGLLFSPDVFRAIFKPRLKRLVEHIRRLADARIYIHSDGAVSELIPDFIEIGIDGLNPVQYTAKGMQADHLKREFGKEFGFFGGGIENEVLSYGTVEDIQRDARRQIQALAPGGGYLYATIHNIPPEVPPQNIVAFFEAGLQYGQYPIRGSR